MPGHNVRGGNPGLGVPIKIKNRIKTELSVLRETISSRTNRVLLVQLYCNLLDTQLDLKR